jgi:hypothetical protein
MGWRIVQQPNGLFARFSEIVDDFTYYNLSEQDVIDLCKTEYRLSDDESKGKLQRAIDNPGRWNEALGIIETIHGINTANERRQMIIDETAEDDDKQ